ncbi:hypothetical protein ASF43_23705 [Pseudorhodoferax sp. Leaf267]|nr:hypothetical protein ASF43_23705 [Pseudorhodoferax sp. Leaf267]
MRRTMVAVAREMSLVDFHEATSVARALPLLATRPFRGLVLDIGDGAESLALLEQLRAGALAGNQADLPVIALTSAPTPDVASRLEALRPLRTLNKPFRVGQLLDCVSRLRAA